MHPQRQPIFLRIVSHPAGLLPPSTVTIPARTAFAPEPIRACSGDLPSLGGSAEGLVKAFLMGLHVRVFGLDMESALRVADDQQAVVEFSAMTAAIVPMVASRCDSSIARARNRAVVAVLQLP